MILGVSATGEWVNQGGFYKLVDGTRWEARTREHAYAHLWPTDMTFWTAPFDPAVGPTGTPTGMPAHACSQGSTSPDRVVFIAFEAIADAAYHTQMAWQMNFEQVVTAIQSHYPGVKRIELMTMVRGPGTTGPGTSCGTDEDIIQPYIDSAITAVAMNHAQLVVAAPKIYVGACNWFDGTGPHFCANGACAGKPDLVAKLIADYYKAHP